jgi:hypothetical protein
LTVIAGRVRAWSAAAGLGLAAAVAQAQGTAEAGGLPPVVLRDLHYGDVLFHFYQGGYFDGIVRAEAYGAQGRMAPHSDDAELLLGGMYLSFGQHARAAEVFERLLARESTPPAVRDRAWFHLGRVLYARSYFEESERALRRAGGALPPELDAERRLLLAQGLMYRGRYDDAVAELTGWTGPEAWTAYGRFNLGVALVRAGRLDQGLGLLESVGSMAAQGEELKALRDKANVAAAYAMLQAERPLEARAVLERVRLNGPQSSKALLGAGWADVALQRYSEALAPWLELEGRGLLDAAVQESYLAVPYAYARLGAEGQAAELYERAIRAYDEERSRLDESIAAIRSGRMLEAVLEADREDQQGWFWQLATLPDAPESRYLYHLLAGHEFQEALKNYRSLDFLGRNLAHWRENLDVFGHMVDTRRRAFQAKVPGAGETLGGTDVEALDARRDALKARLDAALRDRDPAALADADELRQLAMLAGVRGELALRPDDPALADARDKARLAQGVLQWELDREFALRAWRTRRALRELDAQLFDARTRQRAATSALAGMPARDDAFEARIATLAPRVAELEQQVARLRGRQAEYLASLAVSELEAQQGRLAEYSLQARYALATLYDRASAGGGPVSNPVSNP